MGPGFSFIYNFSLESLSEAVQCVLVHPRADFFCNFQQNVILYSVKTRKMFLKKKNLSIEWGIKEELK